MAVLELVTDPHQKEPEREVLFTINGTEYTIPKEFGANLGLQFIRITLTNGPNVALSWALETALGEAGHIALISFEQLKTEQLDKVASVITGRIIGSLEAPKGGLRAV